MKFGTIHIVALVFAGVIGAAGLAGFLTTKTQVEAEAEPVVMAGIVPHYSLVPDRIDEFWATLAEQADPALIILIGPDHDNSGSAPISTTASTRIISSQIHSPYVEALIAGGYATLDDDEFIDEHAIQLHIPSISRSLPEARIVPLVVRSDTPVEHMQELADELRKQVAVDTAVVASVDFSHYENIHDAAAFDLETLAAIQEYDYETMAAFGPEHIDSEQAVVFASQFACPSHECDWALLYSGSSADLPGGNPETTTTFCSLLTAPQ